MSQKNQLKLFEKQRRKKHTHKTHQYTNETTKKKIAHTQKETADNMRHQAETQAKTKEEINKRNLNRIKQSAVHLYTEYRYILPSAIPAKYTTQQYPIDE